MYKRHLDKETVYVSHVYLTGQSKSLYHYFLFQQKGSGHNSES